MSITEISGPAVNPPVAGMKWVTKSKQNRQNVAETTVVPYAGWV